MYGSGTYALKVLIFCNHLESRDLKCSRRRPLCPPAPFFLPHLLCFFAPVRLPIVSFNPDSSLASVSKFSPLLSLIGGTDHSEFRLLFSSSVSGSPSDRD